MRKRRAVLIAAALLVGAGAGLAVLYDITSFRPQSGRQSGDLALVGATVLAGDTLTPVPDRVVLVRDGVITEVGTAAEVTPPEGADVLDLSGYTLVPGLIDLHVHLGSPEMPAGAEPGPLTMPGALWDAMRYAPGHRRASLEHGVTTVRSLGDELAWVAQLRTQVADGELEGPRIVMSGPLFTTVEGHPIATVGTDPDSDMVRLPSTAKEARSMVRALAHGPDRVDVIKVVHDRGHLARPLTPLPRDVLDAIVDEAHTQGLSVTAHWSTLQDLDDLLSAGVDGLEHIESQDLLDGWPEDVLARLVQADVPLTATLVVSEAALAEQDAPGAVAALQDRVRELHAAGGRVVVGSDAARPGVGFGAGVHRELELLVASGLSPLDALRAATVEAARVLATDTYGTIAAGKAADLVVIDGDPTANISVMSNVVMTFRDGRLVVDTREAD
jgi:enamidase